MIPREITAKVIEKCARALLTPHQRADEILSALTAAGYRLIGPAKFSIGQRVTKIKGSSWTGKVVGFYSTALTPAGYAVESENEPGSVQIYPEAALRHLALREKDDG